MKNEKIFRIGFFVAVSLLLIGMVVVAIALIRLNTIGSVTKSEGPPLEIKESPRAAQTPAGTTTFCFRLDGREDRHLPDLMGLRANDIYANNIDGFNWSLPATATGEEDYGILSNGTIFAKKSFIEQYGAEMVEIKSSLTGWEPVKMELSEVNEEPAYVYK